ncbi:MAG TPA: hypothetical protein VFW44_07160 [Bryobacteraceae bacterium]|nr:hypothetical protein [Bryobacteraceae bacterium]
MKLQADTTRLQQEAQKLLIEFASADLDTALTFVRLARSAFADGNSEHAETLLSRAQDARDAIEKLIARLPPEASEPLSTRLNALIAEIWPTYRLVSRGKRGDLTTAEPSPE